MLQSGVGLGEELLPGGGEAHAAWETLEQLSPELLLKGTDLLGEGRLGDQEVLGGGGDRAVLGDRHEVLELAEIHAMCIAYRNDRYLVFVPMTAAADTLHADRET